MVPVQKHGSCALPPLAKAADTVTAMATIAEAVAAGGVAPAEAASLTKVVEGYANALELHDIEARVTELERHDMAQLRRRNDGT
jgi:hypothetical protein